MPPLVVFLSRPCFPIRIHVHIHGHPVVLPRPRHLPPLPLKWLHAFFSPFQLPRVGFAIFVAYCTSDLSRLIQFSVAAKLQNLVFSLPSCSSSCSTRPISCGLTAALLTVFESSPDPNPSSSAWGDVLSLSSYSSPPLSPSSFFPISQSRTRHSICFIVVGALPQYSTSSSTQKNERSVMDIVETFWTLGCAEARSNSSAGTPRAVVRVQPPRQGSRGAPLTWCRSLPCRCASNCSRQSNGSARSRESRVGTPETVHATTMRRAVRNWTGDRTRGEAAHVAMNTQELLRKASAQPGPRRASTRV